MAEELKLLGCPWCGVIPEIRKLPDIEPPTFDITCRNRNCPRRWQFGKDPAQAAYFWNTRTPADSGEVEDGVAVIARERQRQIQVKGHTPDHDDEHDLGELGLAAALYALPYDANAGNEPLLKQDDFIALHIALETGCNFFIDPEPDPLRRLAKAGALIAAEIDRRTRAARAALTEKE